MIYVLLLVAFTFWLHFALCLDTTGTDTVTAEQYRYARDAYYATCEGTEGMGERGQRYVDMAHDEMAAVHHAMSESDQKAYSLPRRYHVRDDGTHGLASGLAAVLAARARAI